MASYTCGTYHRRGTAGRTTHHIRVDKLDELVKLYVKKVRDNSTDMLAKLNEELAREPDDVAETERSAANIEDVLLDAQEELKATKRQRVRDILTKPHLEKRDLELIIERIYVYEDHVEIELNDYMTTLFQIHPCA